MRSFDSFNDAYCPLVLEATQRGLPFTPRKYACHELRPGTFSLEHCTKGLYTGYSRRLNYRFLAVETLCYLAGWGDQGLKHAELLCHVNSKMLGFVRAETGQFDGAYGPRLIKSLGGICDLLKEDPSSRQCYASIWEPGNPWPSKDVPCTLGLHFYQDHQNGGLPCLSMSAYMRSNDLNWGTPYDVAAFCSIQIAMAACVGLNPGRYHHTSGSLHVYDDQLPSVACPETEQWLPEFAICLPTIDLLPGRSLCIRDVIDACDFVCHELHDYLVVRQQPATDFVSRMEVCKGPLNRYFKAWSDLIRFSWKEVQ